MFHEGDQAVRTAGLRLGDFQRYPSAIQHDEPLGDVKNVVDVVADEQDRAATFSNSFMA